MAHWAALEADFQAVYQLDLAEACWGENRLGLRRLKTLVDGLGPGTNLARALDPNQGEWDIKDELLACAVERLQEVAVLLHTTSFKPPHPEPLCIPRPGDRPSKAADRRPDRGDFRRALLGGG